MPSTPKRRQADAPADVSPPLGGRATLQAALPDALKNAVETYRAIAFEPQLDDAKAFQQHQAACKAALTHIEALLKLADASGVEMPAADGAASASADALLARAEAAYRRYASEPEKEETVDE